MAVHALAASSITDRAAPRHAAWDAQYAIDTETNRKGFLESFDVNIRRPFFNCFKTTHQFYQSSI